MAIDRRSDSHRGGVFGWLAFFLKHAAKNQVHGSLRVSGGMSNEPVILVQSGNPALNVSGCVAVGVLVGNLSDAQRKAAPMSATNSSASAKGAVEAAFVAGAVAIARRYLVSITLSGNRQGFASAQTSHSEATLK